jgi:hypothetical protein
MYSHRVMVKNYFTPLVHLSIKLLKSEAYKKIKEFKNTIQEKAV